MMSRGNAMVQGFLIAIMLAFVSCHSKSGTPSADFEPERASANNASPQTPDPLLDAVRRDDVVTVKTLLKG